MQAAFCHERIEMLHYTDRLAPLVIGNFIQLDQGFEVDGEDLRVRLIAELRLTRRNVQIHTYEIARNVETPDLRSAKAMLEKLPSHRA